MHEEQSLHQHEGFSSARISRFLRPFVVAAVGDSVFAMIVAIVVVAIAAAAAVAVVAVIVVITVILALFALV